MGQGNTKPSREKEQNEFATIYIQNVLEINVANLPTITKAFHLLLFLNKDGNKHMYDDDCKTMSVYKTSYGGYEYGYRYLRNCDSNSKNKLLCLFADSFENMRHHSLTTLNINIDCTEINQIIKTHAHTELQNQRDKQTKFALKNIEFWKREIIVCNDKIVKNDAYIQQNKLSKQEIDNIILTNTDLYKTRREYEKLVNDSNADTNNRNKY